MTRSKPHSFAEKCLSLLCLPGHSIYAYLRLKDHFRRHMENQSFALEQLEDRALFSCVAPLAAAAAPAPTSHLQAAAGVRAASHNPLSGAFNVAGSYTQPFHNPDV